MGPSLLWHFDRAPLSFLPLAICHTQTLTQLINGYFLYRLVKVKVHIYAKCLRLNFEPLLYCCVFTEWVMLTQVELYTKRLDEVMIKRDDGIRIMPELYIVPSDKVAEEKRLPKSVDRHHGGKVSVPLSHTHSCWVLSPVHLKVFANLKIFHNAPIFWSRWFLCISLQSWLWMHIFKWQYLGF